MSRPRPLFAAITGATASGKTALSIGIARRAPAEIVSMDSRQVYRGMDIGTDKASPELRAEVPHHGIDLIDPDERYSAGRFARDARRWIHEIRGRNRLPLLVGGTGFFLRAVLEPMFDEPEVDRERREALRGWLDGRPRSELEAMVRALDPERAETAIEGGPHRIGRTVEIALLTGRPLSEWHRVAAPGGEGVHGVVLHVDLPRAETVARIDRRVTEMAESGLVDEVRGLLEAGYGADTPGMTGVGYREVAEHLAGRLTLDEALERVRVGTRQYARRQATWFRHQLPHHTVRIDGTRPVPEQVGVALDAMKAGGLDVPSAPLNQDEEGLLHEA